MRRELLNVLCCPHCHGLLELSCSPEASSGSQSTLEEGALVCSEGHRFQVHAGIPRLLLSTRAHDQSTRQVADVFSHKWKHLAAGDEQVASGQQALEFKIGWVRQKYGWSDDAALREYFGRCERILDAGCGLGRDSRWFASLNPRATIIGLDVADSVEEAWQASRHLPNVHVVQGDIMHPPFGPGTFDFIYSEGVLHHTEDTETAFGTLCGLLRPGGEIAIYVYRKKGPIREFTDDFLRNRLQEASYEEAYAVCEAITELGRALTELNVTLNVPRDIPLLGIKAGPVDIQRFIYWNMMKCFWNPTFSFTRNNVTNLDWYTPAFAHRHTPEEVEGWFSARGLELLHFNVEEAGITARGRLTGVRSSSGVVGT
ncbi:MAG: methyltransferase domain-containing protein [Chloroflexi bacterium]|nr:methyltransferase domain-containing protein [Chloroflexota bacterium]